MATAIDELKKYPNWVCWRQQKHPTKPNKFKKPIISPVTGQNGSHTDPDDWTTYDEAKAFYYENKKRLSLKGLGFVFSDDVPIVGIDVDNCVDEFGELNKFAKRQISTFKTYAEWSVSGNGVHLLGKSDLLFPGVTSNKRGNELEIYSKARYFVITGKHIEGTPTTLEDITVALSYRVQEAIEEYNNNPPDIDIDDVVEMLNHIPGDGLDYNSEWLRILMSVHSEFPGADGLAAVENWTGRYCNANELQQKWNSFRAGGIGIGTLIHFAREHGYESAKYERTPINTRLSRIKPALTPVQAAQVKDVVEELATERAWEIYNKILIKKHMSEISFPEPIVEHFQLGYREKTVDTETGEILPDAITVPYYVGTDVVGIEFRQEDEVVYDGEVGLYRVRPMVEDETSFGIVLPDSFAAIDVYLSGMGQSTVYGLPQTDIKLELPDQDLYCIIDDNSPMETLELLDAYGAKFVKVPSVEMFMQRLSRSQIESIAVRGKKLNGVI